MAFDSPPFAMDGTTEDAELFRRALGSLISPAGGVVTAGDLAVSQQGTPNMSVQIAAGQVWVPGSSTPSQGLYYSRNGSPVTVPVATAHPTLPRVDIVAVQVSDAAYAGTVRQLAPIVIQGTATAGATLSTLYGIGGLPASSLALAYVLVPAGATSIVNADIANTAPVCTSRFSQATTSVGAAPTGMWGPSDWGAQWRASRTLASSRLVSVIAFGASITEGFYSSSFATKGYFGRLIAALQALYGDGGSGFLSLHQIPGVVGGSAGQITVSGSGGAYGGWDPAGLGYSNWVLFPHAAGNGAQITATGVRGTTIKILWYPGAGGSAFTYSIDGAAPVSVPAAGAPGATLQTTTIGSLSAGNHTVVITATAGLPLISAIGGFNLTGIVGHNAGQASGGSGLITAASGLTGAGWTTNALATVGQIQATGGTSAGHAGPDLLIVGDDMAVNDIGAAVADYTHQERLASLCDTARSANPNCEIIILAHHRGNTADASELYATYLARAREIAETYAAAYVNMWAQYRNSYTAAQAVNYWGTTGSNSGVPGSDPVHPGDEGHRLIQAQLLGLLSA